MCPWGERVCMQTARGHQGKHLRVLGGQAEEVAGTARVLIPLVTVTGGENSECDNVTALHKLRNPLGLPPGQEVRSKATWPLEAQNISQ